MTSYAVLALLVLAGAAPAAPDGSGQACTTAERRVLEPLSYSVSPHGTRVFYGYRHPELSRDRFESLLGEMFMPGTPYMLAPLGLAAYVAGVLDPATATDLPHEFALIVYSSAQAYAEMRNTLRGRLYTQTHAGVYDLARSRSSFPVALETAEATSRAPFFVFDEPVDWQRGRTEILVASVPSSTSEDAVRTKARATFSVLRPSLREDGWDQVIVATGERFVIAWFHHPEATDDAVLARIALPNDFVLRARVRAERVPCRGDPPTVSATGTKLFNFIFLREPSAFLR